MINSILTYRWCKLKSLVRNSLIISYTFTKLRSSYMLKTLTTNTSILSFNNKTLFSKWISTMYRCITCRCQLWKVNCWEHVIIVILKTFSERCMIASDLSRIVWIFMQWFWRLPMESIFLDTSHATTSQYILLLFCLCRMNSHS